jgi:hypothetical protein
MVLGDAFEYALGRSARYVKIPAGRLDRIQNYIDHCARWMTSTHNPAFAQRFFDVVVQEGGG